MFVGILITDDKAVTEQSGNGFDKLLEDVVGDQDPGPDMSHQ